MAEAAPKGLVHVSDDAPGFRRLRRGKGFSYVDAAGRRLRDAAQLDRIRRLAIPPAYTDVWICPRADGHLQATGRDARRRKQYRYHAEWRRVRDEGKFDRLAAFGSALPRIRQRVARDLALPLDRRVLRDTVIATVVRLLDATRVRVGNEEYARSNGSFGLTTLRRRHVALSGSSVTLHFRGKSGITHEVGLDDRRVARVVRRCQSLPGQALFRYRDEAGELRTVDSDAVNDYLRDASGADFTAKDFRTWHGSAEALQLWRERQQRSPGDHSKRSANELLAVVAESLGNTVAVCRKSYVHPRVLALLTGEAAPGKAVLATPRRKAGLDAGERALLAFLS